MFIKYNSWDYSLIYLNSRGVQIQEIFDWKSKLSSFKALWKRFGQEFPKYFSCKPHPS